VITTLAVANYRSLRDLVVPLGQLNVVAGANGTGKSSLYRALRLLADSSRNGAVAALAREGGLPSTLWAGPETIGRAVRERRHPVQGTVRTGRVSLQLGYSGDEFGYAMDLGLPVGGAGAFSLDPEIKRECIWSGPLLRPATLLTDRGGTAVRVRAADGQWQPHSFVQPFDSVLSELADPLRAPDVLRVRETMRSWRFYDHVRTDADAPARRTQVGSRTPVLSADGSDLAAALETIRDIGEAAALDAAVDEAFPGSQVEVRVNDGRFDLLLHQHGLLRPLSAAELSDGTLRYLVWVAALLTPRPPALLVLNEPENSLHPDLLRPLAGIVVAAAAKAQTVVVTHSRAFVSALEVTAERESTDLRALELVKEFGETGLAGQGRFDAPAWVWPKR
jgi:predicted ATPase